MKKLISILVVLFFASTILTNCSGYSNDAVGKTYEFKCNNMQNNCSECDSRWFIEFVTDKSATIYSAPSSSSYLKSCKTKIVYDFNSETGSIAINNMENKNINNSCRQFFIGTYTFNKEGPNGIGFYKESNCGFSR